MGSSYLVTEKKALIVRSGKSAVENMRIKLKGGGNDASHKFNKRSLYTMFTHPRNYSTNISPAYL